MLKRCPAFLDQKPPVGPPSRQQILVVTRALASDEQPNETWLVEAGRVEKTPDLSVPCLLRRRTNGKEACDRCGRMTERERV